MTEPTMKNAGTTGIYVDWCKQKEVKSVV